MIFDFKEAKTLSDTVYCLEKLAYYFNIQPKDFWNSRYKEMYLYCEMQMVRVKEGFKQEIILQEAVTDKLIRADSMSKKPKVIPLRNMFKELVKKT